MTIKIHSTFYLFFSFAFSSITPDLTFPISECNILDLSFQTFSARHNFHSFRCYFLVLVMLLIHFFLDNRLLFLLFYILASSFLSGSLIASIVYVFKPIEFFLYFISNCFLFKRTNLALLKILLPER